MSFRFNRESVMTLTECEYGVKLMVNQFFTKVWIINTLSITNDVCRRINVVAETSDDKSVELGMTRRQDVEPDDLGLREGRVPSYQDQHVCKTTKEANGMIWFEMEWNGMKWFEIHKLALYEWCNFDS